MLANALSQRATIALELGGTEDFSSIHDEASSMLARIIEDDCKNAECKLIFDALIQLQKNAVLLEIKQNLRSPISDLMRQAMRPKKFFLEGRESGLSVKEFAMMAVEVSLGHARKMLDLIRNLPHEEDDTSLIHAISQNPDLAIATFMAIGIGAYLAYVELCIAVPDAVKPQLGDGLKEAIENRRGNTELLMALIAKFTPTVFFDVRQRGPAGTIYTRTHSETIKFLSQKYSGNEETEDYEGLDSITLGPLMNTYYLSIITDLRETTRLRYAAE